MIRCAVFEVSRLANVAMCWILGSSGLVGATAKAQIQENVAPVNSIQFIRMPTRDVRSELVAHGSNTLPGLNVLREVILRWVREWWHPRRGWKFEEMFMPLRHRLWVHLRRRVLHMIRSIMRFCAESILISRYRQLI